MIRYDDLSIIQYQPHHASEWRHFLSASNNGTIFHDLDFLSYHGKDIFDEHHLMFYRGSELAAVLPAALVREPDGRTFLKSPYGASVGGPVLPGKTETKIVNKIIKLLQVYSKSAGINGIVFRLGPSVYHRTPDETMEFILHMQGFKLSARWLCFIVPLRDQNGMIVYEDLFSRRKKEYIRSGLRHGLLPMEAGAARLDVFYELLSNTMERHKSKPTHSKSELEKIFQLVPGRARLFLCSHRDRELSGVLVFMLNDTVAYSFYICGENEMNSNTILLHHVMETLSNEGIRHLDMGPSASSYHYNDGVIGFKEQMGARGFCRDEWQWESLR